MTGTQSQRERIRQIQQAAKRKNTITIVTVIVVAALLFLIIYALPRLTKKATAYPSQDGFSVGNPNAPVKVEQFSNYRCSHCRNFSETMEDAFIKKYVEPGQVYMTFYNLPFPGDDTNGAVEAAYCAADQNRFWEYKTELFNVNSFAGAFAEENLIDYASQIDLDMAAFTQCLESDVHLADIESDLAYATEKGINATPQFLVNGIAVYSNTLDATVDAALGN